MGARKANVSLCPKEVIQTTNMVNTKAETSGATRMTVVLNPRRAATDESVADQPNSVTSARTALRPSVQTEVMARRVISKSVRGRTGYSNSPNSHGASKLA